MLQFLTQISDIRVILILTIALCAVLLMSFSVHEFAHAFVAYKCGDPTAKSMGRLTINPFAHIDWLGFCCCLFFGFGWAKPVPINPVNFRKYKKGIFLTSIAGVVVNLLFAVFGCGLLYLFVATLESVITNVYVYSLIYYFLYFLYSINLSLLVFNLLPIPPLDGFNAISAVVKYDNSFVNFMHRYGTMILFILLVFFDNILINLITFIGMPIEMFWTWIFGMF